MVGPNTQTAYKVSAGTLCVAGILRQVDCVAEEHQHPEAQLTVLFQGSAANLVTHDEAGSSRRTALTPSGFVYVAPGQPHRVNWKDQGELLHLWLPPASLLELSEESRCPLPISCVGGSLDRGVYEIGNVLMDEFNATGGLTSTMVNHAVSLMVARVMRVRERQPRQATAGILSRARLQPAIQFITDCPEQDFTLAELAALCHSSVFHFARSFAERVGSPPFAFQRAARLEKAQRLLQTTELPVEVVGAAVGFPNAAHFARTFRRSVGCSPRAYRKLRAAP